MKREIEPFGRKKKNSKERSRHQYDDDFSPSKKALQNQYKRKQKHRNLQDWE